MQILVYHGADISNLNPHIDFGSYPRINNLLIKTILRNRDLLANAKQDLRPEVTMGLAASEVCNLVKNYKSNKERAEAKQKAKLESAKFRKKLACVTTGLCVATLMAYKFIWSRNLVCRNNLQTLRSK